MSIFDRFLDLNYISVEDSHKNLTLSDIQSYAVTTVWIIEPIMEPSLVTQKYNNCTIESILYWTAMIAILVVLNEGKLFVSFSENVTFIRLVVQ